MSDKHSQHKGLKIFLAVAAAIVVVAVVAVFAIVKWRETDEAEGTGAADAPMVETRLNPESKTGSYTIEAKLTSIASGSDVDTVEISWDDDWFFQDSSEYNHDLATTCAVLSATANAESTYYQSTNSTATPYMEVMLSDLGFETISTSSYRYRSEIVDEIVDFFDGKTDVTAYAIAMKQVTNSQTGETKTLFLVAIRGSYGSEWISDANLGDLGVTDTTGGDHAGFAESALDIMEQLEGMMEEAVGDDGALDDFVFLFTGHSRGASVANILASYFDGAAADGVEGYSQDAVFAYTFACPRDTTKTDSRDTAYDNIFNILNPSDLVPRLPLENWGWDRYGVDLWLPEANTDLFEDLYPNMETAFLDITGVASSYEPNDVTAVDALEEKLGEQIPDQAKFETVGGIASLVKDLALDIDVMQVLRSHYPMTYVAWMKATDANVLRTSR